MTDDDANRRQGPDRRQFPRGGRRLGDQNGYAPLLFVVTRDPARREFWEQMLLLRHFAIAPCDGAGPALDILRALRPDVIVADGREAPMLRDKVAGRRQGASVPVLELPPTDDDVEGFVESIRAALRRTLYVQQ